MIAFTVPGECRGKGRPRFSTAGGFARTFTDAKTRSYEALVAMAAQAAMQGRAPYPRETALSCKIEATFAIPASWSKRKRGEALMQFWRPTKKPDLDNAIKAFLDGMQGIVFADDVQVVTLEVTKRYGEVPGVAVEVRPA